MAKPTRDFNANEGDYSVGLAGPDAIENDIDGLIRMFDPGTTHDTGEQGGVGPDNVQDNAILDNHLGNRTLDDKIEGEYTNTSFLNPILSFFARVIREIKGTERWSDTAKDSLNGLSDKTDVANTNIEQNRVDMVDHKVSDDHDIKYYTKFQINDKVETIGDNLHIHKMTGDHDYRYYGKSEINDKFQVSDDRQAFNEDVMVDHKAGVDHDGRYYTKEELLPWISNSSETKIREEIFKIIEVGPTTFKYRTQGNEFTFPITEEGYLTFGLNEGIYQLDSNRVEVIIDDTLRRTVKSGGIVEIDNSTVALTDIVDPGTEVTIKYYERIGMTGEYSIRMGKIKPVGANNNILWIKEL